MSGTVLIKAFSENGTLFNWIHDDGHFGDDVSCATLLHGKKTEGSEDKTLLIVEDMYCSTKSYYPMSGGPIAQELHKHHLEADSLENVQADATIRGIDIAGKDQAVLIAEIIKDECKKQGVEFLL